ncbi:hypothetical protein LEP1GSC188_4154 [Leptospira weilii serovar Topaz str. LT2116]|uniref:Uncharacterized protein n=1 Tax=Leptospira weilii serovar Topaz str. LT2116 TaxID=1088540 RepID=M3H4S8_9LEPT|nr:hypothetical protein LEP1GSC188_4154 [Leptospira weilii serovar Topaz str. LT2116]
MEVEKEPTFFRLGANSILRLSFFEAMNHSLHLNCVGLRHSRHRTVWKTVGKL